MPEIDTAEVRINYLDQGSGIPLVLLHGGGPGASGQTHYGRNIEPLSKSFRVLAPDLPNFGGSGRLETGDPTSVLNARVLNDFLDQLGVEAAHVVGYSMGGSTAITFAADYPKRVRRLMLLGGGGASLPSLLAPTPTQGNFALADFAASPTRDNLERAYRLFLFDPKTLDPQLIDEIWEALQNNPRAPRSGPAPARDDLLSSLPRISAPTLVVRGRDDRYAPLDQGLTAIWSIPNANLLVLSHCGHWIPYEKPEEFNRVAENFFLE